MIREVKGELHHLECNWYSHYKQLAVCGHGETPNFSKTACLSSETLAEDST
jgi:hypothetical protein